MQQSNSPITVRWQWKSNLNPFLDSEEAQWTSYNPIENQLLEEAYQNKQEEVELGDYIISIKDKLQKRKDDASKQRPIRRKIEYSDENEDERIQEENIRAERFFGVGTAKTLNEAFGNLEDYLKFFQNRSPQMKKFASLFNEIETNNNMELINKTVQPSLLECIENESKKMLSMSKFQKQYLNKLLTLFKEDVASIKDVYANVLTAYTMAGFLYLNLNLYLRSEDWGQLDCLLPYAYCLCKAFLQLEFTSNNPDSDPQNSMILYRGARFDKVSFSFYENNTVKNFCWNGVTSTSKKLDVAKKFLNSGTDPEKPVSVLFVIEVPLENENIQNVNWIDIKPYSALKNEDEVVLPPGSVFELTGISRDQDQNFEKIHLKLMTNVSELVRQGQIMHGAMNSEMGSDTSLRFVCLEERELKSAITHLKGNQLIEELEFSLCQVNEKFALSLADMLKDSPQLKSLIFTAPITENLTHWSEIFQYIRDVHIEKVKIYDVNTEDHQLSLLGKGIRELDSLKSLTINLSKRKISDQGFRNLCQGIKDLDSLTSLSLDFTSCDEITDECFKCLSQEVTKYFTSLTCLDLKFSGCNKLTDESIKNLFQEKIKYFASLTSLTLDFSYSPITGEGLRNLCKEGIRHLTSLTSLDLNFRNCREIVNESLRNLSQEGIKPLTSLTSLTLDFGSCTSITDEGLNNLNFKSIQHFTSLTLKFGNCYEITDEGFMNLCQESLKNFTLLTSLTLDFSLCHEITDKGLANLGSQILEYLTSLTSLNLNFSSCHKITYWGVNNLSSQGFKDLPLLTSLALKFDSCSEITDQSLIFLCQEDIKLLTSLTSLSLSFQYCNQITEIGNLELKNIAELYSPILEEVFPQPVETTFVRKMQDKTFGTKEKSPLMLEDTITIDSYDQLQSFIEYPVGKCNENDTSVSQNLIMNGDLIFIDSIFERKSSEVALFRLLTLDFSGFQFVTANEWENQSFQELGRLVSLKFLTLNFEVCSEITDETFSNLSSQGLKHLTSLTSLTLNFELCSGITDKGLDILTSQGLKYLTSLTSLNINFKLCSQITDEGLKNLFSQGIKYLGSLTSLNLSFESCSEISDEGLKILCQEGIKSLTSLESLTLNFRSCVKITHQGMKNLGQGAREYFTHLKSLSLNFNLCEKIGDEGLKNLSQEGLKYLTSLESLDLDFSGLEEITDEGLGSLGSQGLKHLNSLKSLTLSFNCCFQIRDEALNNLYREGIKYLTRLKSLNLSLFLCRETTDESLNSLCREGIKHLSSLTSLSLNLTGCMLITGAAFQNFCKMLSYFGFHPVQSQS